MADKSSIEWCDATWNPVRGCSRVSPGCLHCYAERMFARGLPGLKSPTTGEPFAIMADRGPSWTGKVELIDRMLKVPLRWRKPRRIFVNSMSDLFHEGLLPEDIFHVFAVMKRAPWHTFLVLSKRAERLQEITARIYHSVNLGCVLPNVWLGISVEDQKRIERLEHLKRTPAAIRFLSVEPMLEPINTSVVGLDGIDWVICGAESGPGARPMELDWARMLLADCRAAHVPFFMKQICSRGKKIPWEQWPADLQVREWPR